jgi:hypothetical protein
VSWRPDSTLTTLAVCGDPIVSRALVLLLRGLSYDTRFLPVSSLSEPEVLESVQLLLFAPTPELSTEHRNALLASLKDTPGAEEVPVLELVAASEEVQEGEARKGSEYVLSWPCRAEELKRRIQAILPAHSGEDQVTHRGPRTQGEKEDNA